MTGDHPDGSFRPIGFDENVGIVGEGRGAPVNGMEGVKLSAISQEAKEPFSVHVQR